MGRAARRRAEQRAAGDPRPQRTARERPERSANAAERPARYERVGDALARGPERAAPYRRPPAVAGGGLHRLGELRAARLAVDEAIACEVAALVALGTDWGTIGRALGVSRQAARQRYGRTRR